MSYILRLLVIFASINITVILIVWSSLQGSYLKHEKEAQVEVGNLSELVLRDVAATIDRIDRAILSVGDEIDRQHMGSKYDSVAIDEVIKRQLGRQKEVLTIRVVNSQGEFIHGLDGQVSSAAPRLNDRSYFLRHQREAQAGLVISEPLLGKITGQWGLVLSRRINHRDGSFAGLIFAQLSLERIAKQFAKIDLGADGSIALRDLNQGMIVRYPVLKTPAGAVGARNIAVEFSQALAQNSVSGTYMSGATSIDGIQRAHSYRRHPEYPFYVNVGIAKDTFLVQWRRDMYLAFGLVSAMLLTTAFGAWLLYVAWRQREQNLAALCESEARLRTIMESLPVPCMLIDNTEHIIYINPAFTRVLGYQSDDIPTLDRWRALAYADPEERQRIANTWQQYLDQAQSGKPFEPVEIDVRSKQGLTLRMLASANYLEGVSHGSHLVTLYDITERKRAEERIETSEARLRRAELASRSGNWELYLDSMELALSDGALALLGGASKCLPYYELLARVAADDRKTFDAALVKTLMGDQAYVIDYAIPVAEGRLRHLHASGSLDHSARVIHGVVQDISEIRTKEKALVDSEARFRHIFQDSGSIMLVIEPASGEIIDANPAAAKFYGYPLSGYAYGSLIGMNITEINTLAPEENARERQCALREERNYFNFTHRLANGQLRDVEAYSTPVEIDGRKVLLSVINDISARKKAERDLRDSELFAKTTIDSIPELLCVLDKQGHLLTVNKAWREHYARSVPAEQQADYAVGADYLANCRASRGTGAAELQALGEGIGRVMTGEDGNFTIEYAAGAPAESHWFVARVIPFQGDNGRVIVMHEDVSQQKQAMREIERLAQIDALTGVANRRHILALATQEFSRSRRYRGELSILMLDIDHFKIINDTYGHPAGDAVLKQFAALCGAGLREIDRLGRVGGEEFLILLPQTGQAPAIEVAERICHEVAHAVLSIEGDQTLTITVSVGVATLEAGVADFDALFNCADRALYAAKHAGRNRVCTVPQAGG